MAAGLCISYLPRHTWGENEACLHSTFHAPCSPHSCIPSTYSGFFLSSQGSSALVSLNLFLIITCESSWASSAVVTPLLILIASILQISKLRFGEGKGLAKVHSQWKLWSPGFKAKSGDTPSWAPVPPLASWLPPADRYLAAVRQAKGTGC